MKKSLVGFLFLAIFLASFTSIRAQGPDEYWIGLEQFAVHSDGDLSGMTTWRMYLHMLDARKNENRVGVSNPDFSRFEIL